MSHNLFIYIQKVYKHYCSIGANVAQLKKSGGKLPTKLNKMNKQLNLFETVNEATNPACFLGAVSNRVIFSSYVNEKVAWLAYGDFIRFALSNTNGDVRFGYYVDGEPFCSGSFGELRYSGFLKHGC